VTVSSPPSTTPSVSALTLCQFANTSPLTAIASLGNTLSWFGTNATGGNGTTTAPIPSTSSLGTTDYYVSDKNSAGCEGPRSKLSVTVISSPVAPIVSSFQFCKDGTASPLTANALTGHSLNWYGNNATGGSPSSSPTVPSTSVVGNADYYVSQTNSSTGCESPRSKITVTINALPGKASITKDNNGNLVSNFATGNQWLKDGNIVTGATSQTFKPTENGSYSVIITQNGCTGVSSESYYYLITSITNFSVDGKEFQTYPNPSRTHISVDLGGEPTEKTTLRILNSQGKEMLKTSMLRQKTKINISEIPSGIYYIEAIQGVKRGSVKFIKE
jgi:hypothetical protein